MNFFFSFQLGGSWLIKSCLNHNAVQKDACPLLLIFFFADWRLMISLIWNDSYTYSLVRFLEIVSDQTDWQCLRFQRQNGQANVQMFRNWGFQLAASSHGTNCSGQSLHNTDSPAPVSPQKLDSQLFFTFVFSFSFYIKHPAWLEIESTWWAILSDS